MSKARLLLVALVWIVLLAFGVGAWKFLFAPKVDAQRAQAEAAAAEEAAREAEERRRRGGSDSKYRLTLTLRLDAFSGYAVLRSDEFARRLAETGIRLNLVDDGADYPARLTALAAGEADMAVFTIDALVKASAQAGDLPATIVSVIDESVGADAVLASTAAAQTLAGLNEPDARFVVVPDSPSETLARVVVDRFALDRLPDDPFVRADSMVDVFERYRAAKPGDRLAFVMWQPYVSKTLGNPNMAVLADSGQFPAAIVDVLAASDDFVAKNAAVVSDVLEAYFAANHALAGESARRALVKADAAALGEPLSDGEAATLAEGVWWKNTPEAKAHMGLEASPGVPHVEDMIASVTQLLLTSGAIEADPTGGRPNLLFNTAVWEPLRDFRPRGYVERVRGRRLPKLTDDQWERLDPAGVARAPDLVFARGTDRLTGRSRALLDELAARLNGTRYYVRVEGNASTRGNAEANRRLAENRAEAAAAYLVEAGVDANRVRAVGGEPSGQTKVTFVLGSPE